MSLARVRQSREMVLLKLTLDRNMYVYKKKKLKIKNN